MNSFLRLYFFTPDQKKFILSINKEDTTNIYTILNIKKEIGKSLGVPIDNFLLSYHNKILNDRSLITSYPEITDRSKIIIVPKESEILISANSSINSDFTPHTY